ncbi:hypothetical protein CERSUDRAFT_65723 [Gelatoporia subvermispora B]|uniref:Uncharacterized protein n=1 Tax=Ceriporiopsis subvermispora (strain B) TaxID=914234 RepID=M2QIY4_CERS8|nr:hypothetical protein CERSUDRAFT_65723 [Gelatoporia subvermispora B]
MSELEDDGDGFLQYKCLTQRLFGGSNVAPCGYCSLIERRFSVVSSWMSVSFTPVHSFFAAAAK